MFSSNFYQNRTFELLETRGQSSFLKNGYGMKDTFLSQIQSVYKVSEINFRSIWNLNPPVNINPRL